MSTAMTKSSASFEREGWRLRADAKHIQLKGCPSKIPRNRAGGASLRLLP
jgi:hypothetical protein